MTIENPHWKGDAIPKIKVGDHVIFVVTANGNNVVRNALVAKVLKISVILFYVNDEGEHQCLLVRHHSVCDDLTREAWWITPLEWQTKHGSPARV